MPNTFAVEGSDLLKIRDVIADALRHLIARDDSNAALHLAQTRESPLTVEMRAALDRLNRILGTVL